MSTIDIEKLFTDAFLFGKASVLINKVEVDVHLFNHSPKRIGVGVKKMYGDYHGFGSGTDSLAEALSSIRSAYLNIMKKPLPELVPPPVRMWYMRIKNGKYYPFMESANKPFMTDYLIEPEEGEDYYLIKLDVKRYPELNGYERYDDEHIYLPRHDYSGLTDYLEPRP